MIKVCPICQSKFKVRPSRIGKTCSLKCRTIRYKRDGVFSLQNNPAWKGGRNKRVDGYIEVCSPDHPFKDSNGRVMEHRLVMEKILGRYLRPAEKIHHLNIKRDDNRPENLILFSNIKKHNSYHQRICNKCGKPCIYCKPS